MQNLDRDMADEKAVTTFYERTTATFCATVASTLALRIPGLLMWSQSANVSDYAIADGFLKFAGPTALADKHALLEEAMDKETLKLFRLMAERRSSLVTHVFKNLAAGGPEVMLAIPNLVVVGHDAKNTPWTFDSRSNNPIFPSDPADREGALLPQHPTHPLPGEAALASAYVQSYFVPPPALSTGSPNVQGSSKDMGTRKALKRKRDDGSGNQSRAS